MKILTFYDSNHTLRLGIQQRDMIIDVAEAAKAVGVADAPQTPSDFYRLGFEALPPLQQLLEKLETGEAPAALDAGQVKLGPAVPNPGKIICVGLNYRRHAEEAGMAIPTEPVLFSKFNNAITAPGAAVELPSIANEYDYEAELAFVIGRRGKQIPVSDALTYVLGYCNANDVSERALQMRSGQWLLGKSLDGFLPLGPFLLTADEAGDPQDMRVRGWLNGDLRQDSSTADMIFSVAEVIAYASRYMTLAAGDIILTGTPEGVVLGRPQKDWVVPGDEYVVEVGPLGRLVTRFA